MNIMELNIFQTDFCRFHDLNYWNTKISLGKQIRYGHLTGLDKNYGI